MALFPEVVRSLMHRVPFEEAPSVLACKQGIKDAITFTT
jgi:hypothetical protein